MNKQRPSMPPEQTGDTLKESAANSANAWQQLWLRVKSITPKQVGRALVVVALLALLGWLVVQAWLALVPFIIGGAVAYALLPLVNRLDRYMPRWFAVILALTPILALAALFFALLVPVIVQQVALLTLHPPGRAEIEQIVQQLRAYIGTLPPPTQDALNRAVTQINLAIEQNLANIVPALAQFGINATLGTLSALGFVLGFFVIPAWILIVLNQQQRAARAFRRVLNPALREDVSAVLRILDRSLGAFVRGQVVIAFAAGVFVYAGLQLAVILLGRPGNVQYQLLLALFAGLMYLIPILGPVLAALPGVALGFILSPQMGIAALALYIAVPWLVDTLVAPHVQRRSTSVNENLLILLIVALSQLGFIWLLLAAPLTGIVYDLFRYAYGRLSEPSRPAGVIPGDKAWNEWKPFAVQPKPSGAVARRPHNLRYWQLVRSGTPPKE